MEAPKEHGKSHVAREKESAGLLVSEPIKPPKRK